jgi:hypothetical protein
LGEITDMSTLDRFRYLELVWSPSEFHENLIGCLDESYVAACRDDRFAGQHGAPRAPTFWQQAPMLGHSKVGRETSGLGRFAKRYVAAEAKGTAANILERWNFERYCDFAMYSQQPWNEGKRHPILLAEVKADPAELLGGLSNLLSIRAPFKYLFAGTSPNTLERLNAFCAQADANGSTDWPETIIHVIEIPSEQSPPSAWNSLRAVASDSGKLEFAPL